VFFSFREIFLYLVRHFFVRCLWFVSRWISDEEIDMNPMTKSVSSDWLPEIANPTSLFIPQLLPNLSRTSSISSVDQQIIDRDDADTREV